MIAAQLPVAQLPAASPRFVQSTRAAVAYWRQRTQETNDNAIRRLDIERQNLFQAVQIGLALPQTGEDTAVVALQAFDLIERRGYWGEWIPVLKKAVACARESLPLRFDLLSRLGQLQRFAQKLPAAIETHHKAETLARQLGDKRILVIAYCDLGEDYLRHHDYDAAEEYGRAALTELDGLEDMAYWKAHALSTLGTKARHRGNLAAAEEMLSQAVAIRRELNQPLLLARTLNNFALVLQTANKFDQALQCYEEASELLTAAPYYELDKAIIQINLGALYSRREQWDKTEAALRQINLACLGQSNKLYLEAAATQSLGNALLKQGQAKEASVYVQRAVALWQIVDEKIEVANSLGTWGEALAAQGQATEAISLYQRATASLKNYPDDARAQSLLAEFKLKRQQLITQNE